MSTLHGIRDELDNQVLIERSRQRLERLLVREPDLQLLRPSSEAMDALRSCTSTIETVGRAFELYAERPCLAERTFTVDQGTLRLLPELRRSTYADVWRRIEAFASGLAHEGLTGPGAFLAICGFGSAEWVIADFAALHRAAVSVPIQTSTSAADLEQILRETAPSCVVCGVEQLDAIERGLLACPSVRAVIVMDVRKGEEKAESAIASWKGSVRLVRFEEVEEAGRAAGILPPAPPPAPDALATLTYTSGSTGTPKGAMLPERLLCELWQHGFGTRMLRTLTELPMVGVSYMPLNHAAGRMNIASFVFRGGLTAFVASSDMSTLFDDIRLARPTSLFVVPRVAAMIHQHYQSLLVRTGEPPERIMAGMRETFLGDRLLITSVGAAPTPPEIVAFMKQCFDVPVIDVYGSTEAGPLTIDGRVEADVGLSFKLVDVPELGYRTTDQPYPRGELHVRSRFVVPGYYRNEEATRRLFDAEGFLNTGDVVEQRGEDRLVWIDRERNVLKLAQGEFVATSRLEGLFVARSPLIRQMYIHGDGAHAYLLAVVVPDLDVARAGGLDDDDLLRRAIRDEIVRVARQEKLPGHEVPRDFVIDHEPFTQERGLLTDSNKQSRPRLHAHYRAQLDELHRRIEQAQLDEMRGLHEETTIAEKVRRAVGVTLGTKVDDASMSFLQLGGDSLSVVGLRTLVQDLTDVHVPVGLLLDPTSSVAAIAQYVEKAGTQRGPTFAEIHGAGAQMLHAADIRVERLLGKEVLDQRAAPASAAPEVTLLTGANGFLGRFLALELLERGKVYAIVRGANDAAALERLVSTYRTDPALLRRFEAVASRLTVLAGDLMKPRLGLSAETHARLAEEVDLVLHNGALVNHALGYEQLFEPNVLGTAEILRFALERRQKRLAYVSTVGVLGTVPEGRVVYETDDLRTLVPEIPAASGYAAGYGASKWASELLLRDAHAKLGLPVLVFRPSEIMAHRTYRGQVNVPDFFSRLLAGLVYTGIAPASFYRPGRMPSFDGLPVDVVARSIAAPALARRDVTYDTFHVVNPYEDDGVSLDVIVAWVRSAGYRIERISSYERWFEMFSGRLQGLPEAKRQHSPLAILDAWAEPQSANRRIDAHQFLSGLCAIVPDCDIPHVDEALIHRTLDDLAILQVIERPLRLSA